MDSKAFVSEIFRKLKNDNILKCPETQFSFNLTNDEEVLKYINMLSSSSSHGKCDISVKILKSCCVEIAPSLAKKFNTCILCTFIANAWKSAIISPVYKGKDNIDECDNYRGKSILQLIINVYERILAAYVVSYFERNILFSLRSMAFARIALVRQLFNALLTTGKPYYLKKRLNFRYLLILKGLLT